MVPVTTGYFETLRIPLVKGRYFNRSDTPDSLPVAIVNSSVARKYWLMRTQGRKLSRLVSQPSLTLARERRLGRRAGVCASPD